MGSREKAKQALSNKGEQRAGTTRQRSREGNVSAAEIGAYLSGKSTALKAKTTRAISKR